MSWAEQLLQVYENNQSVAGRFTGDTAVLLPLYHTFFKADIEVVLDGQGNFLRANLLDPKGDQIIIPCTEQSASRSGKNPKPHPLVDKIQYVAGDYVQYGGSKNHLYDAYLEGLRAWTAWPKVHPAVRSVYAYVMKGSLVRDLKGAKLLMPDGGAFSERFSKDFFQSPPSKNQDEAVICWRVEEPGVLESRLHRNEEVFDNWKEYYSQIDEDDEDSDLCLISGKRSVPETLHPKNINNMSANAKLISSNDDKNYTYLGKFHSVKSCYCISRESSQKMHHALRWLIQKQGIKSGRNVTVCWSSTGKDISTVLQDGFDLFSVEHNEDASEGMTSAGLASRIRKRMQGYSADFSEGEKASVMVLDAFTDGRLSIVFFQELFIHDFLERVERWHSDCAWHHDYRFIDGQRRHFTGAPAPRDIAQVTHAAWHKGQETAVLRTIERLLGCIVEGRPLPADIVNMAVRRACRREAFDKTWQFEKTLSITCALYRKHSMDHGKEAYEMALERGRTSRDYLYGRLLAVAQNIEAQALWQNDTKRLTNADRLMNRFSEHPYSTWRTIELRIMPYIGKLKDRASWKLSLLDEIMELFHPDDFSNDRALSGEFLLGYHAQRAALWNKRKDAETDTMAKVNKQEEKNE